MILLEILVIPGFGIAGISGFLMIVYSLFKMLILLSTLSDVIELNSERIFLQFLCRRISSGSLAK